MLLAGCAVIVLRRAFVAATTEATGFDSETTLVSVDGAQSYPTKEYVSELQGLAGRPDAIIIENGYFIPVERKPSAKKLRDRYIAQLLVYMRLIEEFEGKKPPYGYVILGSKARKVKVENSEDRQEWLSQVLVSMREAIKTGVTKPDPAPEKCKKCDVNNECSEFARSFSRLA